MLTIESSQADPVQPENAERAECLIVDDEAGVRGIIARAVTDCGVSSLEFDSAAAAIDSLSTEQPKLIFLDVSMGSSDAVEVIRGLASRKFGGAIQIVSGYKAAVLDEVRKIGERHGLRMRDPLSKPFTSDAIRRAVTEECLKHGAFCEHEVPLGEALAKGWLEFWYQPKLDLQTRTMVGAEALARVRHPDHGVVPPKAFLAHASHTDLAELSGVALMAALRDWSYFRARAANLKLAVNVTASDLVNLPLAAIIRENRPRDEDWPGLILELTENEILQDTNLVHEVATQLELYQVGLSIDDFGSGYSSMKRLCELSCVELKLDRSLVNHCGDNERNAKVCAAVVDLCHDLGAVVTAEGIERGPELRELARMGCDRGQGFLFSQAVERDCLLHAVSAQRRGVPGALLDQGGP